MKPLTAEEAYAHGACYAVSEGEVVHWQFKSECQFPLILAWEAILLKGADWFRTKEDAQAYAAWLKEEN